MVNRFFIAVAITDTPVPVIIAQTGALLDRARAENAAKSYAEEFPGTMTVVLGTVPYEYGMSGAYLGEVVASGLRLDYPETKPSASPGGGSVFVDQPEPPANAWKLAEGKTGRMIFRDGFPVIPPGERAGPPTPRPEPVDEPLNSPPSFEEVSADRDPSLDVI